MWKKTRSCEGFVEFEDPKGWYSAIVKWDGCVHYYEYANTPLNTPGRTSDPCDYYYHSDDLGSLIQRLQELKTLAEVSFEHEWPG